MKKAELICDCEILHKEIVDKVKEKIIQDRIIHDILIFYKAMSDETRLKIICALKVSEMCVCDISSLLNMTKSAISHQLNYLKRVGLVKYRKEGKEVFYALKDEHVETILKISIDHVSEEKYYE